MPCPAIVLIPLVLNQDYLADFTRVVTMHRNALSLPRKSDQTLKVVYTNLTLTSQRQIHLQEADGKTHDDLGTLQAGWTGHVVTPGNLSR